MTSPVSYQPWQAFLSPYFHSFNSRIDKGYPGSVHSAFVHIPPQSCRLNKYTIHIIKEHIFVYSMMDISLNNRPTIIEIMNLNQIFSLLNFEHQYLSYYQHY